MRAEPDRRRRGALSQIEGGHRIGDVDTVARLAKPLKVRIEDLLAD